MSSPDSSPAAEHEALPDSERMKSIRTMARAVIDDHGSAYHHRFLGLLVHTSWFARGLEYHCELLQRPKTQIDAWYRLEFTPIRQSSETNAYVFSEDSDKITASIRALNDTDGLGDRPIDRLEALLTSGTIPEAYATQGFEDDEAGAAAAAGDPVENPMINVHDR